MISTTQRLGIPKHLGSGGSNFVTYGAEKWGGEALVNRNLATTGGRAPGTLLGAEGGGYIPTYGESLQAQSLQIPAYTMKYGGGASMGSNAPSSDSTFLWGSILPVIGDLINRGPDYIAAAMAPEDYAQTIGQAQVAEVLLAQQGLLNPYQSNLFSQFGGLRNQLPADYQLRVDLARASGGGSGLGGLSTNTMLLAAAAAGVLIVVSRRK